MGDDFLNLRGFLRALGTYDWWQVAIELLLIGLVVYWVVRFLRGTRGARMLRGIAFVLIGGYLVVRLLSTQFGLDRIGFLYEKFLIFAGLAIIVAFQPELRRALMRLGEASRRTTRYPPTRTNAMPRSMRAPRVPRRNRTTQ